MGKGRFGLVLSIYPILAFIGVILGQPLLCALLFAAAVFAERDEWAGRQSLQALGLSIAAAALRGVLLGFARLLPGYGGFFGFLSTAARLLAALVYLAAILVSIVAIVRVMKGQEANLPGLSALAYRAYGKQPPRPFPGAYPPPPYQQPPYGGPGWGETPPQNGPTGGPRPGQ